MTTPIRRRPVAPPNPCTSVPQIPDARMATTTSPGRGLGSGRSSSGIDPGPRKTSAFMWLSRTRVADGVPEAVGSLLRRQVALRLGEQLVAAHELPLLRVEQRRKE